MNQVKVQLFLLVVLVLGIKAPMAEGCSCYPGHLQSLFCYSEIVIRAKIIGERIASQSQSLYGEKTIEYKIKLIKMFKGFDKVDNIQYVYTHDNDGMCGIKLNAKNKVQYLLSGYLWNDGKVVVELCYIHELWDNLSLSQKKNLKHRYQKGCECQISICHNTQCKAKNANECVWHPESRESVQSVCIKRTNSSCSWYTDKSDQHIHHNVGQDAMGATSLGVLSAFK